MQKHPVHRVHVNLYKKWAVYSNHHLRPTRLLLSHQPALLVSYSQAIPPPLGLVAEGAADMVPEGGVELGSSCRAGGMSSMVI